MAICTNCGAVIHQDDIYKHICELAKIPEKGKEKIPMTTDKAV